MLVSFLFLSILISLIPAQNTYNLYSPEIFNVEPYLSKVDIYNSNDFNIVKYIKNKIFRKDLRNNRKYNPTCTFTEIMRPVKFGLNENYA